MFPGKDVTSTTFLYHLTDGVGTPRARQGSEEIRPKSPNVSNDTFSKRTGFSKIRRKQKIYVEFNNLQPGRRKENGDETKNKQLANRVAQNGNDNNKARGVTRRGEKRRDNRDNCTSSSSHQHFIVVLPRMVTLAPAVTGSDRSDLVETLQL